MADLSPRFLTWNESQIRWQSENSFPAPKLLKNIDDQFTADQYLVDASQGISFVWTGDFQNAKQLLQAVGRRIDKNTQRKKANLSFHQHRQAQHHRTHTLSRLMVVIDKDYKINLRRSPNISQVIKVCLGENQGPFVISLKELLGMIGSYEWEKNGLDIPYLEKKLFPKYGTFAPIRNEYLDLVWNAPLNKNYVSAFDIGTGTGILSFLLLKRGLKKVTATDISHQALECAKINAKHLGFDGQIDFQLVDLFPQGRVDLIVCNPPWIPAKPTSSLELAVYDEKGQMLTQFLKRLPDHMAQDGEAWLIISDLAEHLGLRSKSEIPDLIKSAGLTIIETCETKPRHKKSVELSDSLSEARSKEVTKLYRMHLGK